MAYVTRLTNGVSFDLTGLDASDNGDYSNDPYLNFELPCNATNVRAVLVDDENQTFYNAYGYFMIQRGQQPSDNSDFDSMAMIWTDGHVAEGGNDGGYQTPTAAGLFELLVPVDQLLAGEWFVSLDFDDIMQGGSVTVTWDHDGPDPQTLMNVIDGDNGSLTDGVDVFLTIPAASSSDGPPAAAYWKVSVPNGYVIGAVLEDNASGDLTASVGAGTEYWALILTTGGGYNDDTGIVTTNPDADSVDWNGIAYQNTPFAVNYVNSGETVDVYVNVASYSTVPIEGVRLILSVVEGTQWLSSSDYSSGVQNGGGGGQSGDWIINYQALLSSGYDADTLSNTGFDATAFTTSFTNSESTFAPRYVEQYPEDSSSLPGSLGAYNIVARFTEDDGQYPPSIVGWSSDGLEGSVACILGYTPVFIVANSFDNGDLLLSPTATETFAQLFYPAIVMAYEVIVANYTRTAVDPTTQPVWTSIRREVRFLLDNTYTVPPYSSGYFSEVGLFRDTGGSELTVVNTYQTPYINSIGNDLYSNEGQDASVAMFGFDTTYDVGDDVDDGSDEAILKTVLTNLPSWTGVDPSGNVHVQNGWISYGAVIFTDNTTSSQEGLMDDGATYYLGIHRTTLA